MEKSKVAMMDSVSYIQNSSSKFDIIFLDPPYNKQLMEKVLPYCGKCLKEEGIVVCETEKNEQLPQQVGDLSIAKEYRYGKAKITTYRVKEEGAEECE